MLAYIARRLIMAVFTVWVITFLSFIIIQLPEGDTVTRHLDNLMTQGAAELGPEIEQELRAYLGLGRPLHVRYAKWMWNLLHGDLGRSFQFFCGSAAVERQVEELIGDRILTTVVLTPVASTMPGVTKHGPCPALASRMVLHPA